MNLVTTTPTQVGSFTYGYTALMVNINEENLTGVKVLVESNQVGVDDRDDSGASALMTCCQRGKANVVSFLVDLGADINAEDSDGWTPLHYASKEGKDAIVSYLLSKNADIHHRDDGGWTPLIWACYKGWAETVKLLIDKGADPNSAGYFDVTGLGWASGRNHVDVVKYLISANANVNVKDKYGTTPLIWASRKGHLPVVKLLLAAGADVDAPGMNSCTALIVAAEGNYREVVKTLLEKNAHLDAQDKDGCTALTKACISGFFEIATDLIKAGAAINTVDRFGNSNLIHATKEGYRNIVQILIESKADVNILGRDNKTALYTAIEKFQLNCIPIILAANPNLEAQTKEGDTALMKAVRNRAPDVVALLLSRRAKVSTSDKSGDNSLHMAMRARSKDLVALLLQNPINCQLLYRKNVAGETPYSIDRTSAKPVITQLFGSHGVNSQDEFENSLGYNAYCSALADLLSDPTLHMPLTVGLFAKWGSGKAFLFARLKQELTNFSAKWKNPLFSWSPLLLATVAFIACFFGGIVEVATHHYFWALETAGVCLLFLLTILLIVWFHTQHSTHINSCWHRRSRCIGSAFSSLKLVLQVLLCHPAGRQSNDTKQANPINFYFTEHTKINMSTEKDNTLVKMLCALNNCIELDYGTVATRLYRAFQPQPLDAHSPWRWRKICCIPYYIVWILFFLLILSSIAFIHLHYRGVMKHWDWALKKTLPSVGAVFLIFLIVANVWNLWRMIKAVVIPHRKNLESRIDKMRSGSRQGFLYALKGEVNLMIRMVACLDSFTGRQSRMVIIVDGLDSGEQENVLEILDAVHILFGDNRAPFVILLAIDPNVISNGMDFEFKIPGEENTDPRDYMKNVVNLPFFMKNRRGSTNKNPNKKKFSAEEKTGDLTETTEKTKKQTTVALSASGDLQVSPNLVEDVATLKNENNNLNMLLEGEDYFSDLSPKALRRIMNIIHITGRLMKAFDVDFTWEDLSSWVNVTELWPYRLSWICIYCLVCPKQISDEMSLKCIYSRIKHLILRCQMDKNMNLDACDKKFEMYLDEHQSSLTAANLIIFLPYTISLDPYIRKVIMKKFKPDEKFFMDTTAPVVESNDTTFSEITNIRSTGDSNTADLEETSQVTISSFKQLETIDLEELSVEGAAKLFCELDGFSFNREVFRDKIIKNGISGNVLKCCNLHDLKQTLDMNFGDWEMFKFAVGILRRRTVHSVQ